MSNHEPRSSNALATASLAVGICSVVLCMGGFILGSLGVILSLLSRGSDEMSDMAQAGMWVSLAGLFLFLIFFFLFINSWNR